MKRRFGNIITILCLLMCAATAAFWARSYWRSDTVTYLAWRILAQCESQNGRLDLGIVGAPWPAHVANWESHRIRPRRHRSLKSLRFFRFHIIPPSRWSPSGGFSLSLPHWCPLLLYAAWPAWWHYYKRRHPLPSHPPGGFPITHTPSTATIPA